MVGYTAKTGPVTHGCRYDPKGRQPGIRVAYLDVGHNSDPGGTFGNAIARCKDGCDRDSRCQVFGVEEYPSGPYMAVYCLWKAAPYDPTLVECRFPKSKYLVVYEKDVAGTVRNPET